MAQKVKKYKTDPPEVEFDFGEMDIILTFQFNTLSDLAEFVEYRNKYEISDFKNLRHTHAKNDFKTWIEDQIQQAIDLEDMYQDWEFRFCGAEETNEKTFQHVIYYSIEPNLDENFQHY